jgi:hypothetical protein
MAMLALTPGKWQGNLKERGHEHKNHERWQFRFCSQTLSNRQSPMDQARKCEKVRGERERPYWQARKGAESFTADVLDADWLVLLRGGRSQDV